MDSCLRFERILIALPRNGQRCRINQALLFAMDAGLKILMFSDNPDRKHSNII